MPLCKYLSLFVVCSLVVSGCKKDGPEVTVCFLDVNAQTLECGRADGSKFSLPFSDIPPETNYACLTVDDWQALVTYVKERCHK
jgi:hypothetical protein